MSIPTIGNATNVRNIDSTKASNVKATDVKPNQKLTEEERQALVAQLTEQKEKGDSLTLSKDYKDKDKLPFEKNDKLSMATYDYQRKTEAFQSLLTSMFGSQKNMYKMAKGDFSNLAFGNTDIEKAKASLEGDGEFSINSVATRIMDMAESLSGGDKSKIGLLREAVKKGFAAAGVEVGGKDKLPDISHKTYEEVLNRFDKWEKGDTETDKTEKPVKEPKPTPAPTNKPAQE